MHTHEYIVHTHMYNVYIYILYTTDATFFSRWWNLDW
jgi:hypothetical protein